MGEVGAQLDGGSLHRFVVGRDQAPQALSSEEIKDQLGDPFALKLLGEGVFPITAEGVLDELDKRIDANDPLAQSTQMSFVLGENSQIPVSSGPVTDTLRFLVTRGRGSEGVELIISVFRPDQADEVEVMAWDQKRKGFNFYRSAGDNGTWLLAGNSSDGVSEASEFKGPFESHVTGNFLMKELRAPWINWQSPDATIFPNVFADADSRKTHPWFTDKEPQGALVCESTVAKPAITRWTKARFDRIISDDGTVERPQRIVGQLLETRTANLITSHASSTAAASSATFDLPQTFFVNSEALTEILKLQAPPAFNVSGAFYAKTLDDFAVRLTDDVQFSQDGDTQFAFCVPEPPFEDKAVLDEALARGLISPRLAACLLMVDFANPVFSGRRAALLNRVPTTARITGGQSDFSQQTADAIIAAADGTPDGSPEREFVERWNVGDSFAQAFNAELAAYYELIGKQLQHQEGFDAYFGLAESRRARFRDLPIAEFKLLLAKSNVDVESTQRRMRSDGTVEEG